MSLISLASLTTFGIGGPASQYCQATTEAELIDAVRTADETSQPLFLLSGGSNVLISDDGFFGLVVHVATKGIEHLPNTEGQCWVAAGEVLDDLVALSIGQGLTGLECLSGIPGLVGAALVQNVGAYGAEIASVVRQVKVWDRQTAQIRHLDAAECRFSYRDSVFKQSRTLTQATGRYVIVEVLLQLESSQSSAPIDYAELAKALGRKVGQSAPLTEVRAAVLELRRQKGMIFDVQDLDSHGAGSFFTNPIISAEQAGQLPAAAPVYQQMDGSVKTSAAWLIEQAGFVKGFGEGSARLSSKHCLALTNQGGATANDIIELARTIRDGVKTRFGIDLEPEPVLIDLTLSLKHRLGLGLL